MTFPAPTFVHSCARFPEKEEKHEICGGRMKKKRGPNLLAPTTLLQYVTPLPALTVDELSLSRGDCDDGDDAIKLRSSPIVHHLANFFLLQLASSVFDMTSCIRKGKWLKENTDTSMTLTSRGSLSHR